MTDRVDTHIAGISGATVAVAAHPENLSDLLARLARSRDGKVTIRDIAIALQDRSFGAFLLVFALPNLVPLPPGATFVLGLPLVFIELKKPSVPLKPKPRHSVPQRPKLSSRLKKPNRSRNHRP